MEPITLVVVSAAALLGPSAKAIANWVVEHLQSRRKDIVISASDGSELTRISPSGLENAKEVEELVELLKEKLSSQQK